MNVIKIELTDAEWMSLIDGDRDGGLQRCCANISALRTVLIGIAREGGRVDPFDMVNLRQALGWALDGHEIDDIPALVKVREQLALQDDPAHEPQRSEA